MDQDRNTAITAYDNRMLRIVTSNLMGDKAKVQLPVKAARRLIEAAGKLPISIKRMDSAEMAELLDAMAACLEEEMTGDILTMKTADGTRIRVFVE